jgi:hypothetical protein
MSSNPLYNHRWVTESKSPLHYEPLSNHSIDVKLAAMTSAIAAGADVNELDHDVDPRRNRGTPLHCCLSDIAADPSSNLPLVRLLLEHGADPSIPGTEGSRTGSSVEEARAMSQVTDLPAGWHEFYAQATEILEDALSNKTGEFFSA